MAGLLLPDELTAPLQPLLPVGDDRPPALQPDDRAEAMGQLYKLISERMESNAKSGIWNPNNPIGTEHLKPQVQQSVGMPDPSFRPGVFAGGGTTPMSAEQIDAFREGSVNLYDQASLLGGGGLLGRGGGGPVSLASRRPLANPPPTRPSGGPAATVTDIGGGQRGMMAVPSLRSMTPADAAVAAASEPHLIPKADGGYIGAPAHVRTPEDLERMRANLDEAIDKGAHGRDWYQKSRGWISDITGTGFDPVTGAPTHGDPTQARRGAEGVAAFSPQSDPGTNLQFTLQARNAYTRGEPLPLVRNTQQATGYNAGMAAKDEARAAGQPEPDIRLGPKTQPFGWHLSPDRPYGTTGVNDIWHARSFGYTDPKTGGEFSGTPSAQQHMFMDYETVLSVERANARKAGGLSDWNAANVQAAPWVANKEASLAARYPKWSPERVRETALKTYPDFASGSTAYMPHEQMPGESSGLLGLVPPEDARAFSNKATWKDPVTGRDKLTGDMFWQPGMPDTTGTYRNSAGGFEMNPAQTAHPLVDFVAADPAVPNAPRQIHPGTESALTGSSYARGLLDMQEGTPWHYIDTREAVPLKDATSMRLTGQRPTPAQLEQLQGVADRHGYFLSDTGDGVSLIHAGGKTSPANGAELKTRLKGGMQAEIDAALPGVTTTTGRASGDYADLGSELAESVKGKGQATDKVLAQLDDMRTKAPGMFEMLVNNPNVASKAQANLDRLTPAMRALRPDYVKMLQIVSGGKIKGFMDHVAKYGSVGLPAALAAYTATDRTNDE